MNKVSWCNVYSLYIHSKQSIVRNLECYVRISVILFLTRHRYVIWPCYCCLLSQQALRDSKAQQQNTHALTASAALDNILVAG